MSGTSAAVSAAVQRPPPGGVTEVAPGVLWVRMPLPYALDHVNLWLLDEGDGWSLVDTGHGDDATRSAWDAMVRPVLRGRPLRRVLCTHHHPDHIGLAGWMAERWGAELWCTPAEWLQAQQQTTEPLDDARARAAPFYRRAGVPPDALAPIVERCRSYPENVSPVPSTFHPLRHGSEVVAGGARWRVVAGRGHSPEHACLHSAERRLLISGDQVLPHITPNVSVWPGHPDEDPLAAFLESLREVRTVPDDVLVLPSHGAPFSGLHRRCDELAAHHDQRLDAALEACDRPRTAFEVMTTLFERDLDAHQTTFAIGEAIAHLTRLCAGGLLRRDRRAGEPDRYVRTSSDSAPRG